MNICLLNDSFPPVIDGVANVVMNYGRILTEDLKADVVVGTPRYPDADYENYPYKVIAYPSLNTTDLVAGYRAGYPLAMREIGKMAEFKPDIIHTHCPVSSTIMARILQNETGVPIVFTYHTKFDVDIERAVGEGFLKNETIRAMVSNISACDEVWVVSEGAGDNLRSLGYEGETRVMSNGVDFPKGRVSDDKVREVTSDLDLPEGVPFFLFVGRMMKYKGLPLIIDALNILSGKKIDYRMVFVGGGADAAEMQEKIKTLGITLEVYGEDGSKERFEGADGKTGLIIFTGPERDREKLRAINTRADLFLFPSVYDTNGIVVREAAACGLASMLIRDSCAAEGITDGRNGFIIDENAESMAALLEKVSDKIPYLKEVGQNAMDEIYISWEDSVHAAYDRYNVLHEMVLDGTFKRRKKHVSDYFLESSSSIVKGTEHVFDIPRNIYGGMKENLVQLTDMSLYYTGTITELGRELRKEIRKEIKENVENIENMLPWKE